MKKKKRMLAAALAGLLCLGLAGCGSQASEKKSQGESRAQTQAEQKEGDSGQEELSIGVLKIADSFPVYAAQEEGIFQKKGLKVNIVEFQSASDQSVAYEAGKLDGMMTDMIVQSLVNKSTGDKGMKTVAMAFGGTQEEGRFLLVSTPGSSVKKPQDLKGCKIGISENTMMEYLVTSYLKDLDVDLSQVELVNVPKLTQRLDSVIEGKDIQAAILPDPLAMEAEARGCNTVIDDTKLGKNYSQSVFTLSNEVIENKPEIADKYVAAINEAIDEIDKDPDHFADLFAEKANVAPAVRDKYTVPSYTASCVPTEDEVSSIEDWMVSKGLIDKAYTYDEMVRQQ